MKSSIPSLIASSGLFASTWRVKVAGIVTRYVFIVFSFLVDVVERVEDFVFFILSENGFEKLNFVNIAFPRVNCFHVFECFLFVVFVHFPVQDETKKDPMVGEG